MSSFHHEFRLERLILEKPEDMRYKVHYLNEWPYSHIGIIKTPYIVGTGTLISPNIIMTCAHIIYHTTIPSKIQFFCPLKSNDSDFKMGVFKAKNYFIPQNFKIDDPQPNPNDWAFLYLENDSKLEKFSRKIKPMQLKVLDDDRAKYPISLVGYPGDKKGQMYETCGEIHECFKHHFSYKLDTTTGQSGSPLLARIEGEVFLIGIHQSSDLFIERKNGFVVNQYTNKNWGVRINDEIKRQALMFERKEQQILNNNIQKYMFKEEKIQRGSEGCIFFFILGIYFLFS